MGILLVKPVTTESKETLTAETLQFIGFRNRLLDAIQYGWPSSIQCVAASMAIEPSEALVQELLAEFFSEIAAFDETRAFATEDARQGDAAAEPRLDDAESHKRLFSMFEAFLVGQIEGVF